MTEGPNILFKTPGTAEKSLNIDSIPVLGPPPRSALLCFMVEEYALANLSR